MADVITGTPQLDATELEMISSLVQKELAYKAKLFSTISDVSSFAIAGAKSISFPKTGSFTAVNRNKSTKVDAAALSYELDILLLNHDPTIKYIIDSYADLQSQVDAELESAKRASTGAARYLDAVIASVIAANPGHTVNPVTPADADAAAMLQLQEFCLQNNAELDELAYTVSIDQRTKLLGLSEFTEAQVYGGAPTAIQTGIIGYIYGVPVIISNGIGARQIFCHSKEAVVGGFQRGFRRDEEKAIDYGTGAKKVVWDAVLGVAAVQIEQGTEIDGTTPLTSGSALIAKLN